MRNPSATLLATLFTIAAAVPMRAQAPTPPTPNTTPGAEATASAHSSGRCRLISRHSRSSWYGHAMHDDFGTRRTGFHAQEFLRNALAAYSATTTAYLRETNREGMFVWNPSNLSANVAADPGQGLQDRERQARVSPRPSAGFHLSRRERCQICFR